MIARDVTYVEKACAYITRDNSELLVFRGPGHEGVQIPKGTVEPRDSWTHTVTGTGAERGAEFAFSWVDLPTNAPFALDLDDYLQALPVQNGGETASVAADRYCRL